jgi:hypothetical protein
MTISIEGCIGSAVEGEDVYLWPLGRRVMEDEVEIRLAGIGCLPFKDFGLLSVLVVLSGNSGCPGLVVDAGRDGGLGRGWIF